MLTRRLAITVATTALAAGALAACGSSGTPSGNGSTTTTVAGAMHGTASVAYADSLQLLYASSLQPGFQQESGDQVTGRGNGSTTLAEEILSSEITPGVFISVGKKAIEKLWTKKSNFLMTLATDPLVVAYNPHSSYASELGDIAAGRKPLSDLFTVLQTPGIRIGRTDPNADPQGGYFLLMCELAQHVLGLSYDPAATALGVSSSQPFGKQSQIVDATALISDLQSGEFDVTSAYLTQAVQAKLSYITLPASLDFADPANDTSTGYGSVSVTLTDGTVDTGNLISLNVTLVTPTTGAGAPTAADIAADDAFVSYLLSSSGQAALKNGGYTVAAPKFTGAASSDTPSTVLPASVLQAFQAAGGTAPSS